MIKGMRAVHVPGHKLWMSIFCLSIFGFFSPLPALAKIGVGVGLGEIKPEAAFIPGSNNKLGPLPVINTGDRPYYYNLEITYDSRSLAEKPPSEWFSFHPQNFYLTSGQTQNVDITLKLPKEAAGGTYFAYIEARPVETPEGSKIGIAAATKLEFTVQSGAVLGATGSRQFQVGLILGIIFLGTVVAFAFLKIKKSKQIFEVARRTKRPTIQDETIIWRAPQSGKN